MTEQFETDFSDQFQPEEMEPEPTLEVGGEGTEATVTPPEPTYEYGGRNFTREELDPALRFAQWASENPERWQQLQEWENGNLQFVPPQSQAPVFTEPEPEIDVYSEDYLRSIGEKQRQLEQAYERQRASEGQAAVDAGITAFSQAHPDLDQTEMNKVLQHVHDRELLRTISPDAPYAAKLDAVRERFEEGYRVVFYDRVQAESARQTVNDLNKRRRAAAASSSGASAPRVAPAPTTPEEKRKAYVDSIAQALAEGN